MHALCTHPSTFKPLGAREANWLLLLALLVLPLAQAHHGDDEQYDTRITRLEGVLDGVLFADPHSYIRIQTSTRDRASSDESTQNSRTDEPNRTPSQQPTNNREADDRDGEQRNHKPGKWVMELDSELILNEFGWTPEMFVEDTSVVVTTNRVLGDRRVGRLLTLAFVSETSNEDFVTLYLSQQQLKSEWAQKAIAMAKPAPMALLTVWFSAATTVANSTPNKQISTLGSQYLLMAVGRLEKTSKGNTNPLK